MKLGAILLICCLTLSCVEAQYYRGDHLIDVVKKCLAKEKATKDDYKDMLEAKESGSENAKCFRACLMQQCKFMDASGNISRQHYKDYLPFMSGGDEVKGNYIAGIIEDCIDLPKVEGNVCETADRYITCVAKNSLQYELDFYTAFDLPKFEN